MPQLGFAVSLSSSIKASFSNMCPLLIPESNIVMKLFEELRVIFAKAC